MTIFDKARDNAHAIAQIGLDALKEGARLGAPIHYMDASLGEGLIRHFPDGRRERLICIDGEFTVVESLQPGVAVAPR